MQKVVSWNNTVYICIDSIKHLGEVIFKYD